MPQGWWGSDPRRARARRNRSDGGSEPVLVMESLPGQSAAMGRTRRSWVEAPRYRGAPPVPGAPRHSSPGSTAPALPEAGTDAPAPGAWIEVFSSRRSPDRREPGAPLPGARKRSRTTLGFSSWPAPLCCPGVADQGCIDGPILRRCHHVGDAHGDVRHSPVVDVVRLQVDVDEDLVALFVLTTAIFLPLTHELARALDLGTGLQRHVGLVVVLDAFREARRGDAVLGAIDDGPDVGLNDVEAAAL